MVSIRPETIMPDGRANVPIPKMLITDEHILPSGVIGTISPYPIVVSVLTPHHKAAGMLVNVSGCASFSIKYMSDDDIINRSKMMQNDTKISNRFSCITIEIFLSGFE